MIVCLVVGTLSLFRTASMLCCWEASAETCLTAS